MLLEASFAAMTALPLLKVLGVSKLITSSSYFTFFTRVPTIGFSFVPKDSQSTSTDEMAPTDSPLLPLVGVNLYEPASDTI